MPPLVFVGFRWTALPVSDASFSMLPSHRQKKGVGGTRALAHSISPLPNHSSASMPPHMTTVLACFWNERLASCPDLLSSTKWSFDFVMIHLITFQLCMSFGLQRGPFIIQLFTTKTAETADSGLRKPPYKPNTINFKKQKTDDGRCFFCVEARVHVLLHLQRPTFPKPRHQLQMCGVLRWEWVKKKTPTETTGFGLFFLLPMGFLGSFFLTHGQMLIFPFLTPSVKNCFSSGIVGSLKQSFLRTILRSTNAFALKDLDAML